MSPNVGNFVHDLVEMAKAMEALPGIQAQLDKANAAIEDYAKQVQTLEMRLIDRANDIDALNTAINNAEAGRDEAERMFLETDDKLIAFRRLVSTFTTDAASLLRAQEPIVEQPPQAVPSIGEAVSVSVDPQPKPTEPSSGSGTVDAGHALSSSEQGQSESRPTVFDGASMSTAGSEVSTSSTEGVSVPSDPTAPSTAGDTPSPASAPIDGADTVADAHAASEDRPLPYAGKRWSEVEPRVWSFVDWCDGGGDTLDFNR